ncbi:stellacyanin-like [Rutidosis leptorrhynchoides]|uniref:stellacyanin-like n=1 Tax=Rutidosis leptorrhynchoides TaxID=125765 RepID=UPI003A991B74
MAGLLKSTIAIFVVMMVASSAVAQTTYVVGDAMGWGIPSNGAAAYTSWASGKTFKVGDTLVFNFQTQAHNVEEVTQAAYGPCTLANPISRVTNGPASIKLTTPGNHYYVCGVGAHCTAGQKLTINVVAASSSGPTAPAAPTPAGSMPTQPPPSTNSASSVAAVVPVAFLTAALAIFY